MAADGGGGGAGGGAALQLPPVCDALERFDLYETKTRYYLVGSDKAGRRFRVLKIDRMEKTELNLEEDPAEYSADEVSNVLNMINFASHSSGGLGKLVGGACGVLGFVRFMQGYNLVLATKRKRVARLGGHAIYSVEGTAMFHLPHPSLYEVPPEKSGSASLLRSLFQRSEDDKTARKLREEEQQYRSIFSILELHKFFYFSYSLDLTRTLQFTMLHRSERKPKSMYIWNQYLLAPMRGRVSSDWALPVIHGYVEQNTCAVVGRMFNVTLIARRSRYFAGTRYLKRGINDEGRAANDVETEQIVSTDNKFTAHVQVRASIPLFWTQESSAMVAKPAINLLRVDPLFLATRRHFEDMFARYGYPVLILNLVRQTQKREAVVGSFFARAVGVINSFLPRSCQLDYIGWDMKAARKFKAKSLVDQLALLAEWAVRRTGLFSSHPNLDAVQVDPNAPVARPALLEVGSERAVKVPSARAELGIREELDIAVRQVGVLRSNCIDCLDRTNDMQFSVGKRVLAYQLYALGFTSSTKSSVIAGSEVLPLLVDMYHSLGDAISLQYGGSQMHRQLKKDEIKQSPFAVSASASGNGIGREMLVSFVRHYQNSFQDRGKQDAMNLLLGLFVPPNPGVGASLSPRLSAADGSVEARRGSVTELKSEEAAANAVHVWDLQSDSVLHFGSVQEQAPLYELGFTPFQSPRWFLDPIESFLDENGLSHLRPSEFARAAGRALPAPAEARAPAPVAATSASAASAQDSPAARVPLLKIHRASVTAADEGRSVEESVPRSPRWLSADPVELTFFEQMLSDDKIHNMLIHAAPKVATSTLKDLFGKLGLRRTAPQAATPLAPSPSPVSSTSTNPSNFGDDSDDEDDRESVANSSGSMHGRQASDDWATNPLFQPIPDPMLPSPVARMQTLKAARAMSVAPLSGPSNLQQIFQPLLVAPRPVVRKFTHIAITPRRGIAEASATLSLQPELPFFPFWSSHLAQGEESSRSETPVRKRSVGDDGEVGVFLSPLERLPPRAGDSSLFVPPLFESDGVAAFARYCSDSRFEDWVRCAANPEAVGLDDESVRRRFQQYVGAEESSEARATEFGLQWLPAEESMLLEVLPGPPPDPAVAALVLSANDPLLPPHMRQRLRFHRLDELAALRALLSVSRLRQRQLGEAFDEYVLFLMRRFFRRRLRRLQNGANYHSSSEEEGDEDSGHSSADEASDAPKQATIAPRRPCISTGGGGEAASFAALSAMSSAAPELEHLQLALSVSISEGSRGAYAQYLRFECPRAQPAD